MPLRLLKRNRKQYNVVSKSTFVISVELLDNGIMECTLDAESTGRDCLLNISQRLGLHQPEFFGLRYISRGVPPRQRWVELDRPLRKQLEKHAQDSQLSLGIMFYVNDVNLLKDEMARYHYFLQLKSDVIDGKLNCSIEQAISLAAYSLQAEFGDFDPERHTVEYLRDFAILPKELISQQKYPEINVDGLYEAVVRQYASLIGFPPPLAEIYYIMVAQQLDGYGQEPYPAKDDAGNDILICVSANGLLIRRRDWTHIAAFRWSDIKSLIGHKRLFVVESSQSHRTMQYHFTDAEVAKYVRKMCILQSTFYKENIQPDPANENIRNNNYSGPTYDHVEGSYRCLNIGTTPDIIAQNLSGSTPGSSYSFHNTSWNPLVLGSSLNSSGFNMQLLAPHLQLSSSEMSQLSLHPSNQDIFHGSNGMPQDIVSTAIQGLPDIRANGVPLTTQTISGSAGHGPLTESGEMHSLLHGYERAISDYTTALQLKYGNAIPDLSAPKSSSQLYFSNQRKSSNEDEPIYQNEIVSQMHSMELRDSLSNSASEVNGTSNSASSLSPNEDSNVYVYKPPPPYPGLNAKQDKVSSESSSSNLSLSRENGAIASKLSPSATSVVSAQVHTEPSSSTGSLFKSDLENRKETDKYESTSKLDDVKPASPAESVKVITDEIKKQDLKVPVPMEQCRGGIPTNKAGQLFGKPIDPTVLREFQVIPKAKNNPNFSTALKRENSKRNRSPEVLPYEDNAIRLNPSRLNPGGYINASPLSVGIGDKQWKYIVGQIPLTGNSLALWQMIWETDVKVIVCLEKDSSALFYPLHKGGGMSFNDFQIVESKGERSSSASIAREFTVTINQKKKQRTVWILPYEEEWKDDVPIHTEHFLCFLEEVNSIQRRVSDAGTPLTVLCGTGAGRSGIFILSDLLLHAADSGHKLRCDTLLGDLRTQRMSLVSTASQYAFVLHTLAKYLAQSRLI